MFIMFLLCVFGLWLYWGYVSVTKKKDESLDCFENLDRELKKRYEIITHIISVSKNCMPHEQSLIDEISKLRDEVVDLGLKPEFMNRRMALDKELERKSEQLLSVIKVNPQLMSDMSVENSLKSYEMLNNEVNLAKQDYNASAKILRKAVDVFPSSFMARLNKIQSTDYMK